MVGEYGWRQGLQAFAVFPLVLLPLLLVFLKDSPASIGAARFGETPETLAAHDAMDAQRGGPATTRPISRADIVLLGSARSACSTPRPRWRRTPSSTCATRGSRPSRRRPALAPCSSRGSSARSCRASQPIARALNVWLLHQVVLLVGIASLTYIGLPGRWPGLILLGYGWGGCFALTQMAIADRFAGPNLGRLMGWFILFEGFSAGCGSWLTGVMFDRSGGYLVPFTICVGLVGHLDRRDRAAACGDAARRPGIGRHMNRPLALITGSARGIGAATAEVLGRRGHHVIVSDVLHDEGRARVEALLALGLSASTYRWTSAAPAASPRRSPYRVAPPRRARHPGQQCRLRTPDAVRLPDDEAWHDVINGNLSGMLRVTRAAVPRMREARAGSIVGLSSIAGHVIGWSGALAYSSAKAGIVGFVRALAVELGPHKSASTASRPRACMRRPMTCRAPRRQPADIANVVAMLSSRDASYITGQVLVVEAA